jgi:GAF domain-containing protein
LADSCAQAMDRLRAVSEAADRSAKLKFLADASSELASSLDYPATLRKVARLAVPGFADWCSISLMEDGDLRPLEVAHVDPAKVAYAGELQARYPPDRDAAHGAWNVVRTGQGELIPQITDEMLAALARDEEHLRLYRELNLRSAIVVPLTAHGRVLG